MEYEFHLQDPASAAPVYLLEALIAAARDAAEWNGIFAFASRAGVDALLVDPETQVFLARARLSLLVGIDAVTNRGTLERLQELEQVHERLSVRVFWNRTPGLFHPKIARFIYPDGRRSIIVGSGNLTPGGLQQNFEAFSIVRARADEALNTASWDRFLNEHAANIRAIDNDALERAARNVIRGVRGPRVEIEPEPGVPGGVIAGAVAPAAALPDVVVVPAAQAARVLVAQIPAGGARWHQAHFNREIVDQFFRVEPNSPQRVYLVEAHQDGTFGEQEVRPCVFSEETNRNLKIELGSHPGAQYPQGGQRPVAVFRELQARSFVYMLLLPGEPGHHAMMTLNERLPSVGRGAPSRSD